MSEELNDFDDKRVFQQYQMLRHVLEQSQEAAFRVVPRVSAQFLLVRLQALHDSRNAKLIVAFGAIQSS